jgi:uncharacterized protein
MDGGQMLNAGQEQAVTKALHQYEEQLGRQMVVVTVASLDGLRVDNYARCLGNRWGIGDAQRDDGIVVLLSKGDRQMRLATGRGAEALLTDAEAATIVNGMTPIFKRGDFAGGLLAGIAQVGEQMGSAKAAGR